MRYLVITPLLLILGAAQAFGQRYGQWSWDALLGIEGRRSSNLINGERVSDYGSRELRLSLGLNGFVLSPAVARFRLRFDTWFTDFGQGSGTDSTRW